MKVHHPIVTEGGDAICDPNVKQYTGYFKLTTGGLLSKNYFYWYAVALQSVMSCHLQIFLFALFF